MSNAYDKASLVMIPTAQKEGKVYSAKPTDGSGDFTFSRGADTATRVNEQGYIEKERGNVLLQSNSFDTTWLTTRSSVISGQSGYDGTNNAWKITGTNPADGVKDHYLRQSYSATGVLTISGYFKAAEKTTIRILFNNSDPTPRVDFDLANGSVHNKTNTIDASIVDVGNGWYRCSVTGILTTNGLIQIYATESINVTSWVGDDTSGVLIQDAQLEKGLVATDYIETTTVPVYSGILDNTPRLDYSNGATCPSLLLEPQRTNNASSSEYGIFNQYKSGVSFLNNVSVSPEGVKNAGKIIPTSDSAVTRAGSNSDLGTGYQSGDIVTYSVFLKADGYSQCAVGGFFGNESALFDLTDGSVVSQKSNVINAYSVPFNDGWYRCVVTYTFQNTIGGNGLLYAGLWIEKQGVPFDGIKGILWYGVQVEEASYPTSYIPTYGTSVTRTGEVCGDAGDVNTFNDAEGVLYVEVSALANDGTNRMISLSDNSTNNHIRIYPRFTDNRITLAVKSGGVNQYVFHYDLSDITDTWKVAVKYKANDFATFVNGTKVNIDTSGSTPIGLNSLYFNSGSGSSPFYGNVKQVLTFNTALSDTELAELTTI